MKKILLIIIIALLSGCANTNDKKTSDNNENQHSQSEQEIDNNDNYAYEVSDISDISNSSIIIDEEGRELLCIDVNEENINYLRKFKAIDIEEEDEFGNKEIKHKESYYCPLYEMGWRLIAVEDYAMKIDSDSYVTDRPDIIWSEKQFNILNIKGKFYFTKLDDYESFDLHECLYYVIYDGNKIGITTKYDEQFPF